MLGEKNAGQVKYTGTTSIKNLSLCVTVCGLVKQCTQWLLGNTLGRCVMHGSVLPRKRTREMDFPVEAY